MLYPSELTGHASWEFIRMFRIIRACKNSSICLILVGLFSRFLIRPFAHSSL